MKKFIFFIFIVSFVSGCTFNQSKNIIAATNLKEQSDIKTKFVNLLFKDESASQKAIAYDKELYLPLETVFSFYGYIVSSNDNEIKCVKGTENISIFTDKEYVLKNDLRIFKNKDLFLNKDLVYIHKTLLEDLLPIQIKIEDNNVVVNSLVNNSYGWIKHNVIAHALGGVDGRAETCALEAFEYNYKNGTRVFEADFILTSDDELISRHDWSSYLYNKFLQKEPEGNDGKPLSLKEIKSMPIYNELTPMDFKDVAIIMSKYKDIFLVTDTKETEPELVKKQFTRILEIALEVDPEILDRIIPQFYLEDMYFEINNLYNFKSYIYTLYMTDSKPEQVLDFALKNNIKVITMHYDRANENYLQLLGSNNITTYLHTINNLDKIKDYVKIGAHGFYTDFVTQIYFNLEME